MRRRKSLLVLIAEGRIRHAHRDRRRRPAWQASPHLCDDGPVPRPSTQAQVLVETSTDHRMSAASPAAVRSPRLWAGSTSISDLAASAASAAVAAAEPGTLRSTYRTPERRRRRPGTRRHCWNTARPSSSKSSCMGRNRSRWRTPCMTWDWCWSNWGPWTPRTITRP